MFHPPKCLKFYSAPFVPLALHALMWTCGIYFLVNSLSLWKTLFFEDSAQILFSLWKFLTSKVRAGISLPGGPTVFRFFLSCNVAILHWCLYICLSQPGYRLQGYRLYPLWSSQFLVQYLAPTRCWINVNKIYSTYK